nr:sigma-70 family RNA polymerase sigma factor [Nocardioides perillae]
MRPRDHRPGAPRPRRRAQRRRAALGCARRRPRGVRRALRRHVASARRLARQLSPSDADDLVSDAFGKVLGVLQRGGGPDLAFRAYLLTAVRRLHVDRVRAGRRTQPTDDLEPFDPGTPFRDTAVEGFEGSAAARAFASLPERWQLVLWHTEVEGQKPAEVAPLLGMSPNSVAALAYRAREGLRQAYLGEHAAEVDDDTCRWTHAHLGGFVRGALSRRDTTKVEDHLHGCRPCTAVHLELAEVNSGLGALLAPLLLGGAGLAYAAGAAGGAGTLGVGTALLAALGRARDAVVAQVGAATSATGSAVSGAASSAAAGVSSAASSVSAGVAAGAGAVASGAASTVGGLGAAVAAAGGTATATAAGAVAATAVVAGGTVLVVQQAGADDAARERPAAVAPLVPGAATASDTPTDGAGQPAAGPSDGASTPAEDPSAAPSAGPSTDPGADPTAEAGSDPSAAGGEGGAAEPGAADDGADDGAGDGAGDGADGGADDGADGGAGGGSGSTPPASDPAGPGDQPGTGPGGSAGGGAGGGQPAPSGPVDPEPSAPPAPELAVDASAEREGPLWRVGAAVTGLAPGGSATLVVRADGPVLARVADPRCARTGRWEVTCRLADGPTSLSFRARQLLGPRTLTFTITADPGTPDASPAGGSDAVRLTRRGLGPS